MITEPVIGDDGDQTSGAEPARGAGSRAVIVLVAVAVVVTVVWMGLAGREQAPTGRVDPLTAPLGATGIGQIRSPVQAETADGHLSWQRVPLGERRAQAAGEVAGRLVLAIEDPDRTSRLGFLSPAGLVPGIAVTSPVDHVTSWRDRLLLVGADEDGPVLHLQHADGTMRRLGDPRFAGDAAVGGFAQLVPVGDRLVAVAASPPAWTTADLSEEVRELLRVTGGELVARGPELILEAAPGIVVLRRPLPRPDTAEPVPRVWVSPDGVGWRPVPRATDAGASLALLDDGRVLLSGGGDARVTTDGTTWEDFPTPEGVEGARGHGRLWSDGPFGVGTVMLSSDGYDWLPVRLSAFADPSWTVGAIAAGPAGYAVELAAPPQVSVPVETDVPGVIVDLNLNYTNLRLPDGMILTPGAYRADVDVGADRVTFQWGSGSTASTGLTGLMEAHLDRAGDSLVVTSPDGRSWAPAPPTGLGPAIPWVSGSSMVVDEGPSLLVGTPDSGR